jgi:hypothetical protein
VSPRIEIKDNNQYIKVPSKQEKETQHILNNYMKQIDSSDITTIEGIIKECTERVQKETSIYINDQLPKFIQMALENPLSEYITTIKEKIVKDILLDVKNSMKVILHPINITTVSTEFEINNNEIDYYTDKILLLINGSINMEKLTFNVELTGKQITKIVLIDKNETLDPTDNVQLLVFKNMQGV